MKICFLAGLYPFSKGGAEYQVKILAENFSKSHEVFFITHIKNNTKKIIKTEDAKLYNISLKLLRERVTLYYFYFLQIKRILEIEKPDVIYHRVLMPYTLMILKYANKRKIPFIFHIASEESITFNHSILSRVRKYLLLKILKSDVHIIVQTLKQKEILLKFSTKETTILPNLFYNSATSIHIKNEKNIVWIGKSIPLKQLDVFLNIAESMKEFDLKFVIIARFFEDDLSVKLLERIKQLKNVINLGERHNDFINNYLSEKAYLLINTSTSEGFSNTFLQSWMVGVPVISLNSNPGDIFDEEEMGIFCNNEVRMIEDAILKFISDDEYYTKISNSCYLVANEKFSVEKLFGHYKKYLESKI